MFILTTSVISRQIFLRNKMRNNRRPTFYCLRTQKQNPKTNNQKKLTTYQHYHFIKKGHFNIRKVEIQNVTKKIIP